MKKLIRIIAIIQLLTITVFSLPTVNATQEQEFVITDGVLTAYNGTAEAVTIPQQVYYIGDSAFEGNTKIKSVTLHSGVYYIGKKAFYSCTSLEAVDDSSSVNFVDTDAFTSTKFLDNNSDDFMTVGNVLVRCNSNSTEITVASSVTAIAPNAFADNNTVTVVTLPDSVTQIGEKAFYGCKNLENITIPKTVTSIGANAFESTRWLADYSGDFVVEGNGILVKYKGKDESVKIPSAVNVIAPLAFSGNTTVKAVELSDSTYMIGESAFADCKALSDVKFGGKTYFIDDNAFAETSIKKVNLPKSLKHLGAGVFANCKALKYVRICDNVIEIFPYTFAGCENITAVSIPGSVVTIDRTSFIDCKKVVFYIPSKCYAALYANVLQIPIRNMKGDLNGDDKVTISDATILQKFKADIVSLSDEQMDCADVDIDENVSIKDATEIQKLIAM